MTQEKLEQIRALYGTYTDMINELRYELRRVQDEREALWAERDRYRAALERLTSPQPDRMIERCPECDCRMIHSYTCSRSPIAPVEQDEREALRAERDRYRAALVNVIAAHDARIERPRGWMTRYDAAIDAARAALEPQP